MTKTTSSLFLRQRKRNKATSQISLERVNQRQQPRSQLRGRCLIRKQLPLKARASVWCQMMMTMTSISTTYPNLPLVPLLDDLLELHRRSMWRFQTMMKEMPQCLLTTIREYLHFHFSTNHDYSNDFLFCEVVEELYPFLSLNYVPTNVLKPQIISTVSQPHSFSKSHASPRNLLDLQGLRHEGNVVISSLERTCTLGYRL